MPDPTRTGTHATTPAPDDTTPPAPPADAPPSLPPGYDLLGELGRGGMGVVYHARDATLNRVVAVKMVLAGDHAAPGELARFQAEAEAVARLDHPGVVRVHHLGRHAGRPFFVMEYVPGGSLTARLRDGPLAPRPAAELLERVARGVGYCHAQGLLHRDLKPANILLTADGSPKVTDFGLARRVGSADGPTATGAVLGTPAYMAPEQARGERDIGPPADVYALGAVLYCLLTGRPPLLAPTPLETIRLVLDAEPVSPRQVQPGTPRDLETIALKALQKDPNRRYPTADALADDLRRWLDGRAITARPAGPIERSLKWVRRNRVVAAAAAAVFAALAGGTAVSLWQADRARREAADAESARAKAAAAAMVIDGALERAKEEGRNAEAVADVLEGVFADLDPKEDGANVREKLLERMTRVAAGLEAQDLDPLARARLRTAAGLTKLGLGEPAAASELLAASLPHLRIGLGRDHRSTLRCEVGLAVAEMEGGRRPEAVALLKDLRPRCEAALGPDDPDTLAALHHLGNALAYARQYPAAVAVFEEAVVRKARALGPENPSTLRSRNYLGDAYTNVGRGRTALFVLVPLRATQARVLGADHPDTIRTVAAVGMALFAMNRVRESVAPMEAAVAGRRAKLGPTHPSTLRMALNLSNAYWRDGQQERATALGLDVFDALSASLGAGHEDAVNARVLSADRLTARELHGRALPHLEWLDAHPTEFRPRAKTLVDLATAYLHTGRKAPARRAAGRLAAELRERPVPDDLVLMRTAELAAALAKQGDGRLAGDLFVEIVRAYKLNPKDMVENATNFALSVGDDLVEAGFATEAARGLAEFRPIARGHLPTDAANRGLVLYNLGKSEWEAGRVAEGEADLLAALEAGKAAGANGRVVVVLATAVLGAMKLERKEYGEAGRLLAEGYEGLRKIESAGGSARRLYRETVLRLAAWAEATGQGEKAAEWKAKVPLVRAPPPRPVK